MGPGAGAAVAVAAAAGAFGFAPFFAAKAPEVETARIARPTTNILVISNSLDGKKRSDLIPPPQKSSISRNNGRTATASFQRPYPSQYGRAVIASPMRAPRG